MLVSVPSLPVLKAVQMSQAKLCPIPASNFSCVGIPDQAVPHPCQLGYLGVSFEAAQHCLLSLPCCVRPSRCPPSPCPVVLLPAGTCHRMALHLLFFFAVMAWPCLRWQSSEPLSWLPKWFFNIKPPEAVFGMWGLIVLYSVVGEAERKILWVQEKGIGVSTFQCLSLVVEWWDILWKKVLQGWRQSAHKNILNI